MTVPTTFDLANRLEALNVLLTYLFNDMSEALEEAGVEVDSDDKRAMAHAELEQAVDLTAGAMEKLHAAVKAEELAEKTGDEVEDMPEDEDVAPTDPRVAVDLGVRDVDEHDPLPGLERLAPGGRGDTDLFDLDRELGGDVGLPEGDELDLGGLDPDDMIGMGRGRRPTGPSTLDGDGEEQPALPQPPAAGPFEQPPAIPEAALKPHECRICKKQMPAEARFCPNCGCSKEPPAKREPAIV